MDYNETVFKHLKKFWIDREIAAFSWEFGRILDELPDFTVYRMLLLVIEAIRGFISVLD